MPWVLRAIAAAIAGFLVLVLLYGVLGPPLTPLMVRNAWAHGITKDWVALDEVSPALTRAVVAAEDARFVEHRGVDWEAIRRAREYNARHGHEPRRGGSTITMQCARNVFLWQGKSYVRKALEVAIAWVLELVWGKRRILEVYLNVVEWGPGIYGAEAAARASFGTTAAALSSRQAALLAAVLPNPIRWSARTPARYVADRAMVIERRARAARVDGLVPPSS